MPRCLSRPAMVAWWPALVGVALFLLLFAGPQIHFWAQISLSVAMLGAMALALDGRRLLRGLRPHWSGAAMGLASAAVLYGVFFLGNAASRRLAGFASGEISSIYEFSSGVERWTVVVLLLGLIGPGEEVFWRGLVQKRFERVCGGWGVAATALLYALAHASSGNRMLIVAALVCGVFWGVLYWRIGSLWVNAVSHALWDVAIFVFWPMR